MNPLSILSLPYSLIPTPTHSFSTPPISMTLPWRCTPSRHLFSNAIALLTPSPPIFLSPPILLILFIFSFPVFHLIFLCRVTYSLYRIPPTISVIPPRPYLPSPISYLSSTSSLRKLPSPALIFLPFSSSLPFHIFLSHSHSSNSTY